MNNADKLYKKAIKDQQKRLKPGECLKYIRLVADEALADTIVTQFLLLESRINVQSRRIAENCLFWERSLGQRQFISSDDLADMNELWQMESQVVKILNKADLAYHVKQKSLPGVCKQFKQDFPDKKLSLFIETNKDKKHESDKDLARALVELQVLEDMAIWEYKDDKELAEALIRFTKAIAEAPYKQQKNENLAAFKKYLANDKKQCVRVVGMQGMARLWQQHLNRLPQVTLDVAEAIIGDYKCPKHLLDLYEREDANAAVKTIANLKLNRGGLPQPLQTERRIGNVLSQKLYTLYNSRDPNVCI